MIRLRKVQLDRQVPHPARRNFMDSFECGEGRIDEGLDPQLSIALHADDKIVIDHPEGFPVIVHVARAVYMVPMDKRVPDTMATAVKALSNDLHVIRNSLSLLEVLEQQQASKPAKKAKS